MSTLKSFIDAQAAGTITIDAEALTHAGDAMIPTLTTYAVVVCRENGWYDVDLGNITETSDRGAETVDYDSLPAAVRRGLKEEAIAMHRRIHG